MLFLLRVSLQILPLAVLLPQLWLALAVVVGTALVARRRNTTSDNRVSTVGRWALEMTTALVIPLLMLAWGLYAWPSALQGRPSHESLALTPIYILGVAHLGLLVWLTWRHRRGRLWETVAASCFAAWWTAGALFTSTMAVTNTWL